MKKSKNLQLKQINKKVTAGVPNSDKSKVPFATLLFFCTLFLLASCNLIEGSKDKEISTVDKKTSTEDKETSTNKVSVLTIAASQDTVEIGKSITLTITESPEGSTVTWTSSDPTVASIDEKTGKLSTIALGTVTITAATSNLTSNTLSISVIPKSSLQINGPDSVHLGDTELSYSAELNEVSTNAVSWSITNNAENQYGSIDSNGKYQAPKVWKQPLSNAIAFSIVVTSTVDTSKKASKQVIIETDSFPNPLKVTRDSRAAYSNTNNNHLTIYLGVTELGPAFRVSQLSSVTIPKSVVTIGNSVFYTNNLTSITIPESVTSIGAEAFAYNNLKSVVIPSSVTSIGVNAFHRGYSLTSVTLLPATVAIGDNAFFTPRQITLNIALWEKMKGNLHKKFGTVVTSYKDLDGNDLVAAISISTPQTVVKIGESITLKRRSTPNNIALAWSVDNPAIATVEPATGVLTAVAEGTVKVTATASGVSSNELSVEIVANPPLKIDGPDAVHFGDKTQFKIATASPVTWTIKGDNTNKKYGSIFSNGKYHAPEYLTQTDVTSTPITFTIKAVDRADANRETSKVITIKTDSFPNELALPPDGFIIADLTKRVDRHNLEVFLGVTTIASDNYFEGTFLRSVKLPKSVRLIRDNPFDGNPKLTKIILGTSLWNSIKTVANTHFGSQVSSYADLHDNVLQAIAVTAPQTTLAIGSSISLVATTTPTGRAVTWAVDEPTLATINGSTGELTSVAAGAVKVTATSGVVSSSVEITVE